nr:MAG TPA: hypothetical protein [Caudoviricetes sp.]
MGHPARTCNNNNPSIQAISITPSRLIVRRLSDILIANQIH